MKWAVFKNQSGEFVVNTAHEPGSWGRVSNFREVHISLKRKVFESKEDAENYIITGRVGSTVQSRQDDIRNALLATYKPAKTSVVSDEVTDEELVTPSEDKPLKKRRGRKPKSREQVDE